MNNDCPFCPDNWNNLVVLDAPSDAVRVIKPLNPVVPGHVLVIHRQHTQNIAQDPEIAAELFYCTAEWIAENGGQCNVITSMGSVATQTVWHTHVHIVPRREGDGLHLPWTGQQKTDSPS